MGRPNEFDSLIRKLIRSLESEPSEPSKRASNHLGCCSRTVCGRVICSQPPHKFWPGPTTPHCDLVGYQEVDPRHSTVGEPTLAFSLIKVQWDSCISYLQKPCELNQESLEPTIRRGRGFRIEAREGKLILKDPCSMRRALPFRPFAFPPSVRPFIALCPCHSSFVFDSVCGLSSS